MNAQAETRENASQSIYTGPRLVGKRHKLELGRKGFPRALKEIPLPPKELYCIGDPDALQEGLAIIGARRATPYGLACARRFASAAAREGIVIVSGGAYGCDAEAHKAALDVGGRTVVFLGSGCDYIYPARHYKLFQRVVDHGGAVVSEHPWDTCPQPYYFRLRNRLIAGLAKATLIVEAGLPSGTFSTADEALEASKQVLVVPGAISSATSAGSNRLLYQGAHPIIDDASFSDMMLTLFGRLSTTLPEESAYRPLMKDDPVLCALQAQPMRIDELAARVKAPKSKAREGMAWYQMKLVELERDGLIARFPDGRWGPSKV